MLLACLLYAPAAYAGGYVVSYSSGGSPGGPPGGPGGPPGGGSGGGGITAGGKLIPYTYAPSQPGYYDYSAFSPGIPATASGQITATFTWAGSGPSDLPPPAVIITQSCSAIGPGGAANNGLGSATSNSGQECTGVNYSGKNNPGASFTVTCSPSASSTKGIIYVGYKAEVAPVMLTLTGPTPSQAITRPGDSGGGYSILVGQGCAAGITAPVSACPYTAYNWSVSGVTLQDWSVIYDFNSGNRTSVLFGIGTATNPTVHWYWSDAPGSETVACTATVTPPPGQGSPFSVTATANVNLVVPTSAPNVYTGRVQINNLKPGTYGTGYALYAGAGNGSSNGIVFIDFVYTPAPFAQGQGGWGFVQIVTPGSFCTPLGGFEEACPPPPAVSYNGFTGLDTRVPYAGSFPADNTGHGTADGPGLGYLSDLDNNYRINESFKMYVMYTPPGVDTIPVALTRFDWNWQANDSIPGTTWANWPLTKDAGTIQSTATVSNPPPPQWALVVSGG